MPENREGQRVPEVTFKVRREGQWAELTTKMLFAGKSVVLFALPGAFTPTCSGAHLPRYNELAGAFHANGVDSIVCLAVNDAFVMEAWARDQHADRVTMVPDGNGTFTAQMGMLVDKSNVGYGHRSWRYSMLVRDGLIEKMFIEPDQPGDPLEVSDADTMLHYLNPAARIPVAVSILTRPGCPWCARAKERLDAENIPYEEVVLGRDISEKTLRAMTGRDTVPQIFIDGRHLGGFEDLERHLASG